jgi:serine-type D-Ala-D-Ala carboxypeptidase/endopeptidase
MKMKSTMLPLMLLSAMLPVGTAMAQLAPPVECRSGGSAYEVIDPLFDAFTRKEHVPGVAYGVVHRGRLVHCRAVGVRDVASGEPVTFDTVFRIASMTKSFTALAVLKLRDANKVVLDAPAAKWVPALASTRYPSVDARDIRVRDLLAHSAGFVTDDPWGDRQLDMPDRSFAQLVGAGIPFARMPGLAHEYSNYGYALLGSIVGAAAGTRYQDYLRREVLEPLGMKSSGFAVSAVHPAHRALGYRYEDAGWREEPVLEDGAFTSMVGLHTSARDYASYVSFLLNAWTDRNPETAKIIAKPSRRELARRQRSSRFRRRGGRSDFLRERGRLRIRHARLQRLPLQAFARPLWRIARLRIQRAAASGARHRRLRVREPHVCTAALIVRQASARLYDTGALKAVNKRAAMRWCASSRPSRGFMRLDR